MALEFIAENYAFFLFIVLLLLFLYVERKRLEFQGTFPWLTILLFKTRMGLDKMKVWSTNHPKVFLYLAYLSIFIGVVGAVVMPAFMVWQLDFIVDNELESGGGLVLPVKTDSSYIFYVPFWHWIIAIFILVVVHEFAHGVISERFKIPVKSSGLAFFGSAIVGLIIIGLNFSLEKLYNPTLDFAITMLLGIVFMFIPIMPGAFVEPDEKKLKKKPRWQQIAVFGAGSTSNFIFGFLFLLILLFVAIPIENETMQLGTISFAGVMNQSSLIDYNITSGEIIKFNGTSNTSLIADQLFNLSPNQTIDITILEDGEVKEVEATTFASKNNPERGLLGISSPSINLENKPQYSWLGNIPTDFRTLMWWIALLNIGIGMMNLLPIWITDGGQIARVIFEKYFSQKTAMTLLNIISLIILVLIIFTLAPNLYIDFLELFSP